MFTFVHRRRLLRVAALLTTSLLAGCGDGSSGGTTSTPTPTTVATPAPTATPTPAPTATQPASYFETSEYYRSSGAPYHGAITAWEQGDTGAGVTIGIVDSGIDTSNPEFSGRISGASADVVSGSSRMLTNSDSDHGTDVALVAAAARDGTGVMGIAYGATILMARADTPGTCATKCSFDDVDIASGVDRAVAGGAKVINLSLGGDGASSTMIAAVKRAAAAGVVVVVAAGNDATADPNAFAASLQAAGNGNVIIAGSVDKNGAISSFSDRAGTSQQYFLAALGEDVCCTYANGTIKVTTTNGQQYVEVFSGTSFAAPQIAGAAALLMQAFPKLTAAQVVNLLLSTAKDAGTTGTDGTYGRGILDINAAFQPQGATTLAGSTSQVALGQGGSTSPAMGDAAANSAGARTVVLDGYGRAYNIDLAAGMRGAGIAPRLQSALANRMSNVATGSDQLSLAFSFDAEAHAADMRWSGQLRLSQEDAVQAKALAAQIVARIAPHAQLGFAFAQGSDGLVAQLQGHAQPAFLVAGNALDDVGFTRTGATALALRRSLGSWGITLSAESGKAELAVSSTGNTQGLASHDGTRRFGIAFDRRFGALDATIAASWLDEDKTVLGARFNPGLGAHGADTALLDGTFGWQPAAGWRLAANYRQGWTSVRGSSVIGAGSNLSVNAWSVDLSHALVGGDSVSFRVAQPLRVSSGGLQLVLPTAWDYDTQSATIGTVPLGLAPRGREITTELAVHHRLWRGSLSANIYYRRDPQNYADIADDKGLGLAWKAGF
jgi:subtilisin family serine protease